jgi:hypothetical protein
MTPTIAHYSMSAIAHLVVLAMLLWPQPDQTFPDLCNGDPECAPTPIEFVQLEPIPDPIDKSQLKYGGEQRSGDQDGKLNEPVENSQPSTKSVTSTATPPKQQTVDRSPSPQLASRTSPSDVAVEALQQTEAALGNLTSQFDVSDRAFSLSRNVDGRRVPAYDIEELTVSLVEELRRQGDAMLVGIVDNAEPVEDWYFRIDGPLQKPVNAAPVGGTQLSGFAGRPLLLKGSPAESIRQLVRKHNAVESSQTVDVGVLFSLRVDDLIRRQQEALGRRLKLRPEEVHTTKGTLVRDSRGRVTDFDITTAQFRDENGTRIWRKSRS